MERVTKDIVQKFVSDNQLELNPTHTNLCVPIINRMYKKMKVGIRFNEIKVADNLICDGHHRYLASHLANAPLGRIAGVKTSATKAINWTSVHFEERDWDSPIRIKLLNIRDAKYNNITLEILVERLN